MEPAVGMALAALQLGVEAILVKPKRSMGPFTGYVTISEDHSDELEITDQPVEQGAAISDHAFKRPSELTIEAMWSNSPSSQGFLGSLSDAATGTIGGVTSILTGNSQDQARDIYDKLLALQASRERFDVFTGKRVYKNMLISSLRVKTDKETENVLRVTCRMREVLIATVSVVQIAAPAADQQEPESSAPVIDKGAKQLRNVASNFNMQSAVDAITPDPLKFVTEGLL
jgi:hypothetical protein